MTSLSQERGLPLVLTKFDLAKAFPGIRNFGMLRSLAGACVPPKLIALVACEHRNLSIRWACAGVESHGNVPVVRGLVEHSMSLLRWFWRAAWRWSSELLPPRGTCLRYVTRELTLGVELRAGAEARHLGRLRRRLLPERGQRETMS